MDTLFITQSVYRDLLAVMSRPGIIRRLTSAIDFFGSSGVLAIGATLIDQEVSFCVLGDPDLSRAIEETTLGRQDEVAAADYIFVPSGECNTAIAAAKIGTLEYPEQGATIVYQVESIGGNDGTGLSLSGPGIETTVQIAIDGIEPEAFTLLAQRNGSYPLGLDAFFVDRANRVMALPRSTHVEPA